MKTYKTLGIGSLLALSLALGVVSACGDDPAPSEKPEGDGERKRYRRHERRHLRDRTPEL